MSEPEELQSTAEPETITVPDVAPSNDNSSDEVSDSTSPSSATPNEVSARTERRNNRAREHNAARAEAAEARRALEVERGERQRLSEQMAEMRGQQQAMLYQQRQAQGDPYENHIASLEEAAERHLNAAATATTAEQAKASMKEYHKALRQAATAEARRDMAGEIQKYDRSRPDPETAGMKVTLSSEFPWLPSNENARRAADGYIGVLVAKGRPNNIATYREACAMAARDFRLGGTPERASESRRAAYSGVSGRNGAGAEGTHLQFASGDGDKLRKMAAMRYPELDADAAYKKWQTNVGPRLARK